MEKHYDWGVWRFYMKWLIASDIHGSAYWCKKLLELFKRENANVLVLLGDILYHGPRNELPRDYDPKRVSAMLNDFANLSKGEEPHRLLCVRGNCDAQVDQMVLDFPILADYAVLNLGGRFVYVTHGHEFGEDNPPKLAKGDILIQGHTHIQRHVEKDGILFLNPGSVSIPKGDGYNGCIVFDDAVVPNDGGHRGIGPKGKAFRFVDMDGAERACVEFEG